MRVLGFCGRGRCGRGGVCSISPLLALLLGGVPLACQATDDDTGDPTNASGDDGDDAAEYGLPQIIDPASDEIMLPVNRTEPLVIKVAGVVPGVTQVILNERVLGTLSPATAVGELRDDTLRLELRGAMHVSRQAITLANPGADGLQFSRTLVVSLDKKLPGDVSALVESTLTEGHALTVDGTFAGALLTVVDEQTEDGVALAKIFRRAGEGWSETPRIVPLVGYARASGEMRPPVSVSWASRIDEDEEGEEADVLRVAWRVGLAGESIAAVEVDASGSQDGEVLTLMTSPEPFDGISGLELEWAGYGAPRFFGGDLLVEMVALVDSESAHPGDHRLLQLRWPAPPAAPGQLIPVFTSELMDLDALGPGVDLLDPGRPLLALRALGRQPAFVRRALSGLAEVTVGEPALGSAPGAEIQLLAVTSGFGAWTTVALDSSGGLTTSLIDLFLVKEHVMASAAQPKALPSAAASVAILGGLLHIAVPYGDAEAVHIAVPSENEIRFEPLDGLYCDAIALLIDDPSRSAGPFVCLYQGEVRLGTLTTLIE